MEKEEAQTMTTTDEIALLGRPKLGELYKCTLRIKESKEFKVHLKVLLLAILLQYGFACFFVEHGGQADFEGQHWPADRHHLLEGAIPRGHYCQRG